MKKLRGFQVIMAVLLATVMAMGTVGCNSGPKPIVVVWYPNESAGLYDDARAEVARLIEKATGRPVENRLTTDYTLSIEAIASGSADIAMAMGAVGYVEAKNANPELDVLFVNSDANGKLDEAKYFSWICVNKDDADKYLSNGTYSIANIKGKSMAFVSSSSTSGFRVPTDSIIAYFTSDNLQRDDLVAGGKFFSEVVMGTSHQGSAYQLVSGNVEVAAFCDIETIQYLDLKSGTENTVGAVYAVKQDAADMFASVRGNEFVLIAVSPVFNGPNAYNPKNLSASEVKAIQDLFTSSEVTNNTKIFYNSAVTGAAGLYDIAKSKGYVLVNDSWYNAYR